MLGPDYRDTLQARWVLAELRGLAGDTPAALAELRQLLADEERVFGPDHPDTLAVRRSVAERLEETEGPAAAIAEYEWLLAAGLRVLGPDHPDTLITRHYLGVCRGKAGAPAAAVAELELLLADRARVRGADHPDTLATRSSIGYWLERPEIRRRRCRVPGPARRDGTDFQAGRCNRRKGPPGPGRRADQPRTGVARRSEISTIQRGRKWRHVRKRH